MHPMLQKQILTFYVSQESCSSGKLAPAQATCDKETPIELTRTAKKEIEGKSLTQKAHYEW